MVGIGSRLGRKGGYILVASAAVVGAAIASTVLIMGGYLYPRPTFGSSFSSGSFLEVDQARGAISATVMMPNNSSRSIRITDIAFDGPGRQEFVQLQLQGIIGEYLQAQARSNADEQTAARETAVFMAALDETVSGLSQSGKVVLVHEAIIGGDVPDVTPSVKAAVYAKVPRPQPAQALAAPPQGQAARVEQEMQSFMAANVGGQGGGQ